MIRVGALDPAKALSFVGRRQQFAAEPGRRPAELAPCRRQRLMSSHRGAKNLVRSPEADGRVGAVQSAKAYATA